MRPGSMNRIIRPGRIRLADIDGIGTTDIIYLDRMESTST